jgi:hypothetical protein
MKWGYFAGGAAKGLETGSNLMDAAARRSALKQGQEQSAQRMLWEKQQRERDTVFYQNLSDVMAGKSTPESFYKNVAATLGGNDMMFAQAAGPGAQIMNPGTIPNPGLDSL